MAATRAVELNAEAHRVWVRARELAVDLRARALAVDAAPDSLDEHLDSPALQAIGQLDPIALGTFGTVATLIELARGDAGMVLAAPGPALAGVLTRLIGDEAQNERLDAAMAGGRAWGFLAVTEPTVGSDAGRLRTELRPDGAGGYLLHGTKRFIGNGYRGAAGVVLARTGAGPLSLRAVLVDRSGIPWQARPLDMIGLRGAQISELTFTGHPVRPEDLLGNHLKSLRRGMWGLTQAFNTVRVQVAAMAVGTARAVHDYVSAERRQWTVPARGELDAAADRIESVRHLVLRAARDVDADRHDGYRAAMSKLLAVRVARHVCGRLPRLLGPGALLEHPLLEKWWRDVAAFEFMEGTSDIQRLQVAACYLRGETGHAC
jgi:alkylation response protein AidB-like acyl-CoA dehydrogenase